MITLDLVCTECNEKNPKAKIGDIVDCDKCDNFAWEIVATSDPNLDLKYLDTDILTASEDEARFTSCCLKSMECGLRPLTTRWSVWLGRGTLPSSHWTCLNMRTRKCHPESLTLRLRRTSTEMTTQ